MAFETPMSALYGDSVLYHTSDGVAWITLNRPTARNRLDLPMANALRRACQLIMQDDEVRVAVLTGSSDAFCAGDDSDALPTGGPEARQGYLEARRAFRLPRRHREARGRPPER